MLVREGRSDAGNHSAAIVDQLGEFHIHAPSFAVDIGSAEVDIVDLTGGEAVVGIQGNLRDDSGADADEFS